MNADATGASDPEDTNPQDATPGDATPGPGAKRGNPSPPPAESGFLDADLQGDPEIAYPCRWSYKLIGKSEADLRAAVALVLGQQDYELDRSNQSATGRYCSLALSIVVRDERERRWIGETLHEHADVTMVL